MHTVLSRLLGSYAPYLYTPQDGGVLALLIEECPIRYTTDSHWHNPRIIPYLEPLQVLTSQSPRKRKGIFAGGTSSSDNIVRAWNTSPRNPSSFINSEHHSVQVVAAFPSEIRQSCISERRWCFRTPYPNTTRPKKELSSTTKVREPSHNTLTTRKHFN